MLADADSNMVANTIIHQHAMAQEQLIQCETRPSILFRPKIHMVQGKWYCILDHISGSGDSPHEATLAFDAAFYKKEES